MSLVGQALLMVAARAISGQTWAEDRVSEQPIDPLTTVIDADGGAGKPAVAVYTESVESDPRALETQRGEQTATLKIVAYLPPKITVTEGETELSFEHKGAGFALNVLGRQIDRALHHGNAPWVNMFRKFASRIVEKKLRFLLIELEDGVRIPSLELTYVTACIAEPEFGKALFGYWVEFDTLLREDTEEATLADVIKALIETPSDLPGFEQFQMTNNLTDSDMIAIGLAPMATDEDGEEVTLTEVEIDGEMPVVGPELP